MNQHLSTFLRLFPLTSVTAYEEDLVYRFRNPVTAAYLENMAQEIILANGLPLTAELSTWAVAGVVRDRTMVVAVVKDAEMICL